MTDQFNSGKFRKNRQAERHKREARAAAQITPPAILLSVLIAFCLAIYEHLTLPV